MRDRPLADIVHHHDPVTLPPGATVQEACRRMLAQRVGCVIVTDPQKRLLGIFTGRDAVRRIGAECLPPAKTRLEQAMTRDPVTLSPGAGAVEALRLMQDGGFRHLPLVQDGVVVGVVSRGDFRAMEHARLNEEDGLWETLR
ncbi:MAG TPA: CBS domain-containing protein [Falsiroseomonas sp.]|nr:CBS domain-containing protein [Falsiroseomonas sp.]